MESILEHLEWGVPVLFAALLWVGKMAWYASHAVASQAARIQAVEEAVRQINESCKAQREDMKEVMRKEIRLAIQDFQREQNAGITEIKTMLAVQGTKAENVEKQVSAIFGRLNRRATDRED